MRRLAALALSVCLGAPLTATAIPITYQIKFTVLTGVISTTIYPDPLVPPYEQFEQNAAGKVYFGLFAVDDSILATDGIAKPGNVDFFYIQMEDNIWGYNLAVNNSFVGFRGPIPGNDACFVTSVGGCLFAQSPGFDVVNGTITNLRGGVYGNQDAPFVDFSLPFPGQGPNTFNARGYPSLVPGTTNSWVGAASGVQQTIQGTMEIFRVPEPGALALFGLGLFVLAQAMRRTAAE